MHQKNEDTKITGFSEINEKEFNEYCDKLKECITEEKNWGRDFFVSLQYKLEQESKYELKFKLELHYLKSTAMHLNPSKAPGSVAKHMHSYLEDLLTIKQKKIDEDENYRESFYNYVFAEIFDTARILISNNFFDSALEIYKKGIEFFDSLGVIPNSIMLVLAKGDLYLKSKQQLSALNCYSDLFKRILTLVSNPDYSILDNADIKQIIIGLEKICQTLGSENNSLHQSILQLLQNDAKATNLISFEKIANIALENKDYLGCRNLYYIGSIILRIYNHNPDLITNNTLVKSLIDKNNFLALLDTLNHESCLIRAISSNDNDRAKDLIAKRISVEDDTATITPLRLAIELGKTEIVHAFIKHGFSVHYFVLANKHVIEPGLYLAIKKENLEIVQLLVNEAKADVNLCAEMGHSCLFNAFNTNNRDIVQFLIEKNAKLTNEEAKLLEKNSLYQELISKKGINVIKDLLIDLNSVRNNRTPIFCIHPLSGECNVYKKFAAILQPPKSNEEKKSATVLVSDKDYRPVIGVMSPDFIFGGTELTSIEERAKLYIKAIRQRQPKGPIILCGWSFGGLVAFEMARILMKAGERVFLVGLFDTASPHAMSNMTAQQYAENLLLSLKACTHSFKINLGCLPKLEDLVNNSRSQQIEACIKSIIDEIISTYGSPDNNSQSNKKSERYIHYTNIVKANLIAALNYNPILDEYSPVINCFNSSQSINLYNSEDLGWSTHTKECLTTRIETNHFKLLEEPNVMQLVNYIVNHPQVRLADTALESEILVDRLKRNETILSKMSVDYFLDKNSNTKNNSTSAVKNERNENKTPTNSPSSPVPQASFFYHRIDRIDPRNFNEDLANKEAFTNSQH